MLDCLGDASLHLDFASCGVVLGHSRLLRCPGSSVSWVSLPAPRQDGIGSRAPTLCGCAVLVVVAL